jgi:hypothetical protein
LHVARHYLAIRQLKNHDDCWFFHNSHVISGRSATTASDMKDSCSLLAATLGNCIDAAANAEQSAGDNEDKNRSGGRARLTVRRPTDVLPIVVGETVCRAPYRPGVNVVRSPE